MSIYSRSIASTILIFLIGLMVGMLIDNVRISEIKRGLSESEIVWEDTRLLNIYIGKLGGEQCQAAFEENLAYNDRIYNFGKEIEKEIEASALTPEAEREWDKYVLLQFQFWMNSIELKEKCDFDYSNVVYLSRKEAIDEEEMNNKLQSAILLDIKEKCGKSMMLIPLTADSNLESIDLVLRHHNITQFPAIIIDEEHVFQGLTSEDVIGSYINC
jgi:hypothetical protein